MQLAAIATSPITPPALAAPTRPVTGPDRPPVRSAVAVASPWAPAAVEGALDGAARTWSGPLIDFPGVESGDRFDIVKGSKVGFLGVRGEAAILALGDDDATFHVKAGALGIRVDVEVAVVRTGEETVQISSRGNGIPDTTAEGRIVARRTDYVEFERVDDPSERTIIRHDGRGNITIDTVVPTFGAAHLLLERR